MPPRERPDSKAACYAPPAPPRAAYVPEDFKKLPALPTQCPKCRAAVIPYDLELNMVYVPGVRCLTCGFQADRFLLSNVGRVIDYTLKDCRRSGLK